MFKPLVSQCLQQASKLLTMVSTSPNLDARLLLTFVLNLNEGQLLALDAKAMLSPAQQQQFQSLIEKRLAGWPVAYLVGYKEFYGYIFLVGKGVLIPRADSEIIIETLLQLHKEKPITSLRDIGTGPGTLALSLFLQIGCPVTASDISPMARHYFNLNNKKLTGGQVEFLATSLLNDEGYYDAIVANLPYLTTKETEDRQKGLYNDLTGVKERFAPWQEPALALDGGVDGLDLIKTLIKQSQNHCRLLVLEADPSQMDTIAVLMNEAGYTSTKIYTDLAMMPRIIVGQREPTFLSPCLY